MTQNLLEAACNEEWEKVRRLVEEGENVNGVEGGWTHTALHWAVIFRNADMCSFLLSRGANVNQADTDGHTPLHTAADWQQANICQLLVDHKADVTSVNTKGETPLLIALSTQRFPWLAHDSPSVCRPLITNESVNVADHHGTRPLHIAVHNSNHALHIAVEEGHIQTVQLLVDCGADVNELNEDGQTPQQRKPSHMANESVLKSYEVHNSNHALHIAVEEGHIQTVQLLVDCGADQQRKPSHMANESVLKSYEVHNSNHALHIAVEEGHIQTVQLLVDCGADVNVLNEYGQTPLHTAAGGERDCPELCSILLEHNAKVDTVDKDGNQPLHLACKRRHTATVHVLLSHGADVTALNKWQRKPLHLANESVLKSYRVHNGNHAVHTVVEKGHIQTVQLLVDCGADVDAVDKDGNQPLHLACKQWHTSTVGLLLSHGADLTALNNQQKKPFHFANESVLKSYEVHDGNHALHIAAKRGHIQTVQSLVDCGADVNELNEDGQTPLHTVAGGLEDCPELYKDGNQPLHLACEADLTSTVQYLLDCNADGSS
ncbi:serine/threonine-protein phosphatase 6 regulatory ankyrin repeat subunit B-like [Corticium candelabrum]|uniref:serine/threonine-protein phosphatase 6 regulatory ankyrin repeat subunit B-like n=1 Tax=Corticium candelabrum TaxID=121492 RepID=UPI002E269B65|nr:serine/threonine-protein phosphatase 6 regulatory ankyrin repeat subunit B-like [Corticium candelabrum]